MEENPKLFILILIKHVIESIVKSNESLAQKKKLRSRLKLLSTTFYQIFIFSSNESPLNTMKNVFYFI